MIFRLDSVEGSVSRVDERYLSLYMSELQLFGTIEFQLYFLNNFFSRQPIWTIFYRVVVPKCPTSTQNFSPLSHTIGDLSKIHCKKTSFFDGMYQKRE